MCANVPMLRHDSFLMYNTEEASPSVLDSARARFGGRCLIGSTGRSKKSHITDQSSSCVTYTSEYSAAGSFQ